MVLATAPHMLHETPYMYQGKELGMTSSAFGDIDDYRDAEALRYYREAVKSNESPESILKGLAFTGRDNVHTPVQQDVGEDAGFMQSTPWISVTPNYRDINATSQVGDPSFVYACYRALADIWHGLPIIAVGAFRRVAVLSPTIFTYRRTLGEVVVTVLVNLSSQSAPLDEAARGMSEDFLPANRDLPEGDRGAPETLGEWEALIYIR